jgi:putative hydrolase of the HAD superfamily
LAELGVSAEEAVFVGDNPVSDIAGARNVGMRTIWLPNGTLATDDNVVPDAVIARLSDVVAVIDGWLGLASARHSG